MLRGSEVEINDNKFNITPGLQKAFTDKTYKTAKSMNDEGKVVLEISYWKLNIIIVYLQKVVCQVGINIS